MPAVTIRPAAASDVSAVAAIWLHGWRDGHLGNVPDALVKARTPDSFRSRAAARVDDTTVAEVGGAVAGFVMVAGDEVEQVYVSAAHRGQGVAGALLAEAERRITAGGHDRAWLAVVPGNARARRFYERCGWRDEGGFVHAAPDGDRTIDVPCRRYVKDVSAGDRRTGILLETDRLVLREFTAADVEAIVELDSDPEVMFYINGGRPTPAEEVRDDVLPFWMAYYDRGEGFGFWAAIEKATGAFLGWFHFRPPPGGDPASVELGYRLRRSAWGQGYATEGSRALIRYGFGTLGVERIHAETMVVNTASRRVMEKAGLRQVRVFHQDWPDRIPGDEHGDVEYALTRAEWQSA